VESSVCTSRRRRKEMPAGFSVTKLTVCRSMSAADEALRQARTLTLRALRLSEPFANHHP
jgi:hypothetical protein